MFRVGFSKDIHQIRLNTNTGRNFVLGGVVVSKEYETIAISDGDALIHAIFESMLGALGLGDIAKYYPENTTPDNFNSKQMLQNMETILRENNYVIVNLDCLIVLEEVKISPFYEKIIKEISKLLKIENNRISIKATRSEKQNSNYVEANSIILLQKVG